MNDVVVLRKIVANFSILLILFSPIFCFGQSVESDSLFAIGVELYNCKKYSDAIGYFEKTAELDSIQLDSLSPRASYSNIWISACYRKLGDVEKSRQYYPLAVKPVDRRLTITSDSLLCEAMKEAGKGNANMALSRINKALELETKLFGKKSYFLIGTLQFKIQSLAYMGKYEEALSELDNLMKIESKYYSRNDTLFLSSLNASYNLNISSGDFKKAENVLEKAEKIVLEYYNKNHYNYADILFKRLYLSLLENNIDEARNYLPIYIETLKVCFKDNLDMLLGSLLNIKELFRQCMLGEEVDYISDVIMELTESEDDKEYAYGLLMKYLECINVQDTVKLAELDKDFDIFFKDNSGEDYYEIEVTFECVKLAKYMVLGDENGLKETYMKIQKDSLDVIVDKNSELYPAILSAKILGSIYVGDFESGLMELESVMTDTISPNLLCQNAPAFIMWMSVLNALNDNYKESKLWAHKVINQYEKLSENRAFDYRIESDVNEILVCSDLYEKIIDLVESENAEYVLREIRGEFLGLALSRMRNIDRYQIDWDYYDCFKSYIINMIMMEKYPEAQEAMDNYLHEWNECYNTISENSKDEIDIFDRILAPDVYEKALYLKWRLFNEDKAHEDYIRYLDSMGYDSNYAPYVDAWVSYYGRKNNYDKLLEFLISCDDFKPYYNKYLADIYIKKENHAEAIKYLKKYLYESIKDSVYVIDSIYKFKNTINDIYSCYEKDSCVQCALDYYIYELLPKLDSCNVNSASLIAKSISEFKYFLTGNNLIVDELEYHIENVMKEGYSPIEKACVNFAMSDVLFELNPNRALSYINKACDIVAYNQDIKLYFEVQRYLFECEKEIYDIDNQIEKGNSLLNIMSEDSSMKQTCEYINVLRNHLGILNDAKQYGSIVNICETIVGESINDDFNRYRYKLMRHLPKYDTVDVFLSNVSYYDYSYYRDVNTNYYKACRNLNTDNASSSAVLVINERYNSLQESMDINSLKSYECNDLISLATHLSYKYQTDTLKQIAYNIALYCKGLMMRSDFAIREMIKRSGHKGALMKYDELQKTMTLLSNAPEKTSDSLEKIYDDIKRDLLFLSEMFGDYKHLLELSWKDIRDELKDDEIAIEFTYVDDNAYYMIYKLEEIIKKGYYACVIKKDMNVPEIIYISETIPVSDDVYTKTYLTKMLLGPLNKYLDGVKNIYFSAIGDLNLVSLESLPLISDSTKTLTDNYNLYRLSSTRKIVEDNDLVGKNAVIYGGLKYSATVEEMIEDNKKYPDLNRDIINDFVIEDILNNNREALANVRYLKGTKIEAEQITAMINEKNDTLLSAVGMYGVDGTETSFKALNGKNKRIIHLATHGFYYEQDEKYSRYNNESQDNSMKRTGLLFAGVDNKYMGLDVPSNIDDGILTSLEISNINLAGTDLVVLSACQTGLGFVDSDGVYGLQRGFKIAGANTIMLTLWKVDDTATSILMTDFYRNMMSGMSKYESLEKAKRNLRDNPKYSNPKYWAAFILLDGIE